MLALLKPFAGIVGTLLAALLILSGPYLYWYDRTPTATPLVHLHWWFVRVAWPSNPSARGAAAQAALDRRVRDDAAATAAARAVYVSAIGSWAALDRQTSARLRAALQNVRVVHDQQVKEIPTYVTPETDRRFPLPWGLVRLHDAYALGFATPAAAGITLPAGRVDGDSSPFTDSDLAAIIADNYASDRACRVELSSWQGWYPRMAATWSDAVSHWPRSVSK